VFDAFGVLRHGTGALAPAAVREAYGSDDVDGLKTFLAGRGIALHDQMRASGNDLPPGWIRLPNGLIVPDTYKEPWKERLLRWMRSITARSVGAVAGKVGVATCLLAIPFVAGAIAEHCRSSRTWGDFERCASEHFDRIVEECRKRLSCRVLYWACVTLPGHLLRAD
ncbi:MAG: hypothetical protein SNJ74_02425, partial [Fimbriimonadaceae bacterium]